MLAAAPALARHASTLAITHQTGERDLARVRDGYGAARLPATVEPFLHDMHGADGRGRPGRSRVPGASTLAELTVLGRPMVLVPLPTAADDHQRKNAEALARAGAAEVIEERDLTGERLAAVADWRWPADAERRRAHGRGGPSARPARRRGPRRRPRRRSWRESGDVRAGRTRHVHFVGVGGIGMSGIAELLANLGYTVSGSDLKRSRARPSGWPRSACRCSSGHDAAHVGGADVVVVSSAVRADNPEVVEARARGIPVIPRAEMLAELMRLRIGHRRRRRPRQDLDDLDDRAGAGARRTRSRPRSSAAGCARSAATPGSAAASTWSPRPTKATARS